MASLDKRLRSIIQQFDADWQKGSASFAAALAQAGSLSLDVLQLFVLRLMAVDLEYAWKAYSIRASADEQPKCIEDYLAQLPGITVTQVPIELILTEFTSRHRWGDHPTTQSYVQRFPHVASVLPERCAAALRDMVFEGKAPPKVSGLTDLRKIDEGAFGVVYRATQAALRRHVALKVFKTRGGADKDLLARSLHEAQQIARIQHPNVIGIYDVSASTNPPYLVLEFAPRGSLRHHLRHWSQKWANGRPPSDRQWQTRVAQLIRGVAQGLAAAHAVGVVHRDLKPENILFDRDGRPKLTDFGLARSTAQLLSTAGAEAGTPEYMSPEQLLRQRDVQTVSDIYSLGCVFFELLTGRRPFSGPSAAHQIADVTLDAPSPSRFNPGIDPELAALCELCLQKDSRRRLPAAEFLAAELGRYLRGEPIHSRPVPRYRRWARRVRRHWQVASLSLALVGLSSTGLWWWQRSQIVIEETGKELTRTQQKITQKDEELAQQKTVVARTEQAREDADRQRLLHAYASDLQSVQRAWNEGNPGQAATLLAKYDRSAESADDPRGFEWYYWRHLLASGSRVLQFDPPCRSLAISDEAGLLAAATHQSVMVRRLDSGELVAKFDLERDEKYSLAGENYQSGDHAVALSPDGKFVAATTFAVERQRQFGMLRVWEVDTGKIILAVPQDEALSGRAVVFSPDCGHVIAGTHMGHWKAWNLTTGTNDRNSNNPPGRLRSHRHQPVGMVTRLHFLEEDGLLLASTSQIGLPHCWGWPAGNSSQQFPAPQRPGVHAIAFHVETPDRMCAVSSDPIAEGVHVQVWQRDRRPTAPPQLTEHRLKPPVRPTVASFDKKQLLAGGVDNILYLWGFGHDFQQIFDQYVLRGHGDQISAVLLRDDGTPISGDVNGVVRLWTNKHPEAMEFTPGQYSLVLLVDHIERLATVLDEKGATVTRIAYDKNEQPLTARLSPCGRYLWLLRSTASVKPRNQFSLWNVHERRQVFSLDESGYSLLSRSVFSADGTRLAVRLIQQQAAIYSTADGRLLAKVPALSDDLALDPHGELLANGGLRHGHGFQDKITVVQISTGRKLCEVPAAFPGRVGPWFRFSHDSKLLLVDGPTPTAWNPTTGQEVQFSAVQISETSTPRPGRRRIYRISPHQIEIACAATLRPLVTIALKRKDDTYDLLLEEQISGTEGYVGAPAIDRRLADFAERWSQELNLPSTPQASP